MLREKGMLRPDLHIKFQNSFRDGNISEVIEICKKNDSLITSVLSEGIERISENNYDKTIYHVKFYDTELLEKVTLMNIVQEKTIKQLLLESNEIIEEICNDSVLVQESVVEDLEIKKKIFSLIKL